MQIQQGTVKARNTLDYLRRQITAGIWSVGDRIPIETDLAEQLGVGRSTIREAVRSLASMGMLETLPGRGTFIRSSAPSSSLLTEFLDAYTLEEMLSYRRALEIEAAQQAALHRTDADVEVLTAAISAELEQRHCPMFATESSAAELPGRFHYLIFDAAKNRLLSSLYAGITDKLNVRENRSVFTHGGNAQSMQSDHERIFDAIRRGDFIDAAHAMADHVDKDLVIIVSGDEIIPPLKRSEVDQARISEARARKE